MHIKLKGGIMPGGDCPVDSISAVARDVFFEDCLFPLQPCFSNEVILL